MKILISGSGGFLGGSFAEFCKKNNVDYLEIKRIFDVGNIEEEGRVFYRSSLLEVDFVEKIKLFQPTVFLHFAWKGVTKTSRNEDQYRYNINLTLESVELANLVGCQNWIGLGSQAEYGLKSVASSEDDICNPITNYGKSKRSLSISSLGLCDSLNIKGAWIRVFSVYGERDHPNSFVSMLISKMLANEEINVTDCTQIWDYIYVDDACSAISALLLNFETGIYNLGSGNQIVLKDIVSFIKHKTSSVSKINFGAINHTENSIRFLLADISKIKNLTKWHPTTNIQTGLTKLIDYQSHKSKI